MTAGFVVTDWYSPRGKSNERLRITIYILSRALRCQLAECADRARGKRPAAGGSRPRWRSRRCTDLENAILQRARQIHAETYQNETYEQLEKRS